MYFSPHLKTITLTIILTLLSHSTLAITNGQAKHLLSLSTKGDVASMQELRQAAQAGDVVAERWLGVWYGSKRQYQDAAYWLRKSAALGDAVAENNLGVLYDQGDGVSRDYAMAAKWFHKAAEQGYATAQTNLGSYYANGHGVQKDSTMAEKWLRKGAEQGNPIAQTDLGALYQQGHGVSKSYAMAAKWYRKAADQGNAIAENNLGLLYWYGHGVSQDVVVSYALCNLSASKDPSFESDRQVVTKNMTTAQIATGQTLTRNMNEIGVIKALDQHIGSVGGKTNVRHEKRNITKTRALSGSSSHLPSAANTTTKPICEYKSIMTDDDYRACGVNSP